MAKPVRSQGMIESIQAMRGLAAVGVAAYHVYLIMLQQTGVATFETISRYGYLGVPFFFVLSGFIVTLAHGADVGHPGRLGRYVWSRASRVYPIYWLLTLGFMAAAMIGLAEVDFSLSPVGVLENLLLIHLTPDFGPAPLKVAWTLFFEIRFYILFGLAILNLRLALSVGGAWLVAMLVLDPVNAFAREALSFWNLSFLFGVAGAVGYARLPSTAWRYLVPAGLLVGGVSLALTDVLALRDLTSASILPVSLGFALLILGLALAEKQHKFSAGRFLRLLGDASYSVYLVHSAVISVAIMLVSRLPVLAELPGSVVYFPVLVGAVFAGVVIHWLIEKPLLRTMKRLAPARTKTDMAPDHAKAV